MRVSRLCVTVTLASVSASACTQSARLKTHKFCVCTSLTRGRRPSPPRERYPPNSQSDDTRLFRVIKHIQRRQTVHRSRTVRRTHEAGHTRKEGATAMGR